MKPSPVQKPLNGGGGGLLGADVGRGDDQIGRLGPVRGHFPALLPAQLGQLSKARS